MCTNVIFEQKSSCVGACTQEGTDKDLQREICHPEKKYESMSKDELKEEVKKLRMQAMACATELHDLAEEGLPNRWEDIPKVAEKAYKIHKEYFLAKKVLESQRG
jgi:hypothetical protein